jgi:hypothetical protein
MAASSAKIFPSAGLSARQPAHARLVLNILFFGQTFGGHDSPVERGLPHAVAPYSTTR